MVLFLLVAFFFLNFETQLASKIYLKKGNKFLYIHIYIYIYIRKIYTHIYTQKDMCECFWVIYILLMGTSHYVMVSKLD